jgi:DNA-binding transcriptional LysR family regulator
MACVASPDYLARCGAPRTPHDLARHACINLRFVSSGALYAWEFEKDGRAVNVRVEGPLTLSGNDLVTEAAIAGFGLAMLPEPQFAEALADGRLVRVLEDWCPPFSGFHLYYPSRRQNAPAFALLVEALRYRG